MLICDLEAWEIAQPEDLWIFDKLLLARRLGYKCGPKGSYVPKPGKYIVRPCVNMLGLSRGAKIMYIKYDSEYHIPDGTFWCEIFKGRHLSIDYIDGKQFICVEGTRDSKDIRRWKKWKKVGDKPKLPKIIRDLKNKYKYLNVEMIDGKIIEVHLRLSPDFISHDSPYMIPVYKDEEIAPNSQQEFIMAPDDIRLGFYIKKCKSKS